MFSVNESSRMVSPSRYLPGEWRFPSTRTKRVASAPQFQFSFQERLDVLKQYGSHCMSFSTLQPGMHFFDVPGKGFIAYMPHWGARLALADPVCHESDREEVIDNFIQTFKNCAFVQISKPVAELIHQNHGFWATQFGIETIVDLEGWNLKGKKKQVIRTSVNQSRKKGVVIKEGYNETNHHSLSKRWISTRKIKNREIGFLIRPMITDYEVETRKFYAYLEDELVGFIFFDPIYRNGKIVSYVPNISRFNKSFRQGIFYSIMAHAMEKFQNEGLESLNLGLSILVLDPKDEIYESTVLKKVERFLYNNGNFIYNFKGIQFTKSRFRGETRKFYCAHKRRMPLIKLMSILKLANAV